MLCGKTAVCRGESPPEGSEGNDALLRYDGECSDNGSDDGEKSEIHLTSTGKNIREGS